MDFCVWLQCVFGHSCYDNVFDCSVPLAPVLWIFVFGCSVFLDTPAMIMCLLQRAIGTPTMSFCVWLQCVFGHSCYVNVFGCSVPLAPVLWIFVFGCSVFLDTPAMIMCLVAVCRWHPCYGFLCLVAVCFWTLLLC